jgi:alkylation response protein AidB-like acyl-CoA dehydrogenase
MSIPLSSPESRAAVAAAVAAAPVAARHAEASERGRRLAPEVVEALAAGGLFRLLVPASLGGGEAPPADLVDSIAELARADGAAAWCVAVASTSGAVAAYLPEPHAREVFAEPARCWGGVFAPRGTAVLADDTYTVTGRWPFASGIDHSDWLMGGCVVTEGGEPRTLASGRPDVRLVAFPAAEAERIDTWHVSGLSGTGSHDMAVEGLRVPAGRSASLIADAPVETGPLYAFPIFGLLALAIGAVGLGLARGAMDDLTELAGAKTPAMSRRSLAARDDTQVRVAQAEARLRAARALVHDSVGEAWDEAVRNGAVPVERRSALRLAAAHAMSESAAVVDEMYALGGGTAIYLSSPLQRRFRDVHVATQHMLVGPSVWQLTGRLLLGVPADTDQL